MKKQSFEESGFSLVELIVSIVLFGIVVLVVGQLINVLTQMNDDTNDRMIASTTVQNKIESLRSKGFMGVPVGTVDFSNELPNTLPTPRSASYTVQQVLPPTKSITITLTYAGKAHTYKTFIGELGVAQY